MSIPVTSFLTLALSEIRAVSAGDVVSADDLDLALLIFNEYLDWLNANDRALYDRDFTTYTLTPNLQPHTIGLTANSPTFTVTTNRPSAIVNANIILANNIRSRLSIVNDQGWNAIVAGAAAGQTPTITATIPTVLYYGSSWPNGSIYLWPVPTAAYGLELETETLLAQVALSDTLTLPPGYQQALRLSVAELCAPHLGLTVSPDTRAAARAARELVWGANDDIPSIVTRDAGMPGGVSGSAFDYRTGFMDLGGGLS